MTGFSLPENYTDNLERLVRRARPRVVPPLAILPAQEPISEAPRILEAMAEKTLREFSVPSTDNVATGPNINVGDMNFELKSSLINMVQASPFCGKPNEDANAHLQNFLELCDTVIIRGVAADVVKLRLFPFSLLGKAKQWFYKEKDIDTGPNAPRRSSQNSSRWAKQMLCAGEFQVSSRRGWNPSQKLGRGCRNTSWPVLITAWMSGSSSQASTTGSRRHPEPTSTLLLEEPSSTEPLP